MPDDAAARSIVETMRMAVEAERDKLTADKLDLAQEKIKLLDAQKEAESRTKPSWYAKWTEPGPLLAVAALFGGQFIAYQNDKATVNTTITDVRNVALSRSQEQGAALLALSAKIDANSKTTDERSAKYVPVIENMRASVDAQKLINDQTGDRITSMARSIQDLRVIVDALRDAVQKTHEDMMIDRAKRESRLRPSDHAPPQNDAMTR